MCTLFLWARGLWARVARPPATSSTKKSVHILTLTLLLKSWYVATNVILFAFIRTYRAKKKGRKETKKTRWFTKMFLRWKCVIIIAWHFRACANSSKIGRLGNAQVRNTRLYELSYFCYCLLLPQSSSPNNNNFPSVLMTHCFVKEREASFLLNPFTAKCGQKASFDQISKFHFLKFWQTNSIMWKYMQRAFIWMVTSSLRGRRKRAHHRILSADSKVRLALQNSIKPHSGSEGLKF